MNMDYIDSSVFVYASIYERKKSHTARNILKEIGDGKRTVITSILTLSELLWVLWRLTKDKEFALQQVKSVFSLTNITFVPLSVEISSQSILLMKVYAKLRQYDAIHAATCIHKRIITIISDDANFDGITELKRVSLG